MTTPTLAQEELALIAKPFNDFLTNLQSPTVNILTVIDDAKNLQLSALQLNLPAQAIVINYIASSIQQKFNSLLAPTAPATTA